MKHVSFDVWNTLVTPNKEYAAARSSYLADIAHCEVSEARDIYTASKRLIEHEELVTGFANTSLENYIFLMRQFNMPDGEVFSDECEKIKSHITSLFFMYPPHVCTEVKYCIAELASRGYHLSIGSNSNFITGKEMRKFLIDTFGDVFSFMIFSDLVGYAKPSPQFFDRVIFGAQTTHAHKLSDIIHVGDSVTHDEVGALGSNIGSCIIKDPSDINVIFERL